METIDREQLVKDIYNSWESETAYPKCADQWTKQNPSLGQCAVTALVVQDYLGGIIKFSPSNNHFYNEIRGKVFDLTIDQFLQKFVRIDLSDATEVTRDWILRGEGSVRSRTWDRYRLLSGHVDVRRRI